MNEINNELEDIKVEQALRSENMKLKYRKASNPEGINILDYTVIAALEKQIPKQVIKIEDVASQACPICKSKVNWNYCSNCGQRMVY